MLCVSVVLLLLWQAPASACVAPPQDPGRIIFEQRPRDVRDDLIVVEVVFRDLEPFSDFGRRGIGRARVLNVVQGNARVGGDLFMYLPSSAACQVDVHVGDRGYLVGRMERTTNFMVLFVPAWVQSPETWRRP